MGNRPDLAGLSQGKYTRQILELESMPDDPPLWLAIVAFGSTFLLGLGLGIAIGVEVALR